MVASLKSKLLISHVSFSRFLHPHSIHMEGISQSEKAQGETQTNWVRLSSNYGGVVTQLEKKEQEEKRKNSCIQSDYVKEAMAKYGSLLCLTDTRWQRFAV